MRADRRSPRRSTKRLPEPDLDDGGPIGRHAAQSVDQQRREILCFLLGVLAAWPHAAGSLVEHVPDEVVAGQFGGVARGFDDGIPSCPRTRWPSSCASVRSQVGSPRWIRKTSSSAYCRHWPHTPAGRSAISDSIGRPRCSLTAVTSRSRVTSPWRGARSRTSPTALVTRRLAGILPLLLRRAGHCRNRDVPAALTACPALAWRYPISPPSAVNANSPPFRPWPRPRSPPSARTAGTSGSPLGNPRALSPLHPASSPVRSPACRFRHGYRIGRDGEDQWWRDVGRHAERRPGRA